MEAQKKQTYQKPNDVKLVDFVGGRIMPHAADLEQNVLCGCMVTKQGLDDMMAVIKTAGVFYKDEHRCIYEAIAVLYAEGNPVDLSTVSHKLRALGMLERAGGDYNILTIYQSFSSGAQNDYHSHILLQYYMKRELITRSMKLMAAAYNDETDSIALMQDWAKEQDEVSQYVFNGRREKMFEENLKDVRDKVEYLTNKDPEEFTGVSLGIENVDRFTCGIQPQDLVVIAARPGMGKTSAMLSSIVGEAKNGNHVGVFTLEMSAYQLTARLITMETDLHAGQLTKKGFEKPQYFGTLDNAISRMKSYGIHIDETASADISHVQSKARLWKRKYNITAVYVDYLQLLKDRSENFREQEVAEISRKLKALAKELDIPVIALSQLSRKVEERNDKRPKASDLRESGAIEQDADIIIMLYRPEKYYGDAWEQHIDEDVLKKGGNTEMIFEKYRNGAPDTAVALYWIGDKTKFIDPAQRYNTNTLPDVDWEREAQQRASAYKVQPNDAFGDNDKAPF